MTTDSGHEAGRENFPVPTTRRLPYKLHEAAVRYVSASSVLGSNWKAADVNLVEVGISEKYVPHAATPPDSASHCETLCYITLKYAQVINLLYIY